ncbi:MAG: histidine phosphatase family protein [Caulobacterales bacterium]|jgi:2,3-bisphosphoglycerate-dependent phosphoglycerate mutase
MTPSTLILVRHALSTGQAPEAELAPEGAGQATVLSERLLALGVDGLFSSPYRRAQATLDPYAARMGLNVTILHELHERILSPEPREDWLDHVRRSFADSDYKLAGGESLRETYSRALGALQVIAGTGHTLPAAASHGNLIASVLNGLDSDFGFEQWRGLRNPDIFELTIRGGRPAGYRRVDERAIWGLHFTRSETAAGLTAHSRFAPWPHSPQRNLKRHPQAGQLARQPALLLQGQHYFGGRHGRFDPWRRLSSRPHGHF